MGARVRGKLSIDWVCLELEPRLGEEADEKAYHIEHGYS
jgi:hypothetical protein